jgi:hypothetical protein
MVALAANGADYHCHIETLARRQGFSISGTRLGLPYSVTT